jgi:Leu/Phe-tRNA-protein transferase
MMFSPQALCFDNILQTRASDCTEHKHHVSSGTSTKEAIARHICTDQQNNKNPCLIVRQEQTRMPPNDTKPRKRDANDESSSIDDEPERSSIQRVLAPRGRGQNHNKRPSARTRRPTATTIEAFIPSYLRHLVHPHQGDYCYTTCFHPSLIGQLMMEGFLPIACGDTLCLPKLHEHRCIIHPLATNLHVAKSTRKKSKAFRITLNQAFDRVVRECQRQHGDVCWLYPKLVQAFRALLAAPYMAQQQQQSSSSSLSNAGRVTVDNRLIPVRVHSIEVWNDSTGELAAGELGYTVGAIYTSLTGFTRQDSAGSVQLIALGRLLQQCGFAVWDLGMAMDYKASLGCQDVPRTTFLRLLHEHRTVDTSLSFASADMREQNCRVLIDQEPAATARTRVQL